MKKQIDEHIKNMIAQMTIEEKSAMIHGVELFKTGAVERLGIPALALSDGPMGVRKDFKPDSWQSINNTDDYATYFPCNMAIASTWNVEMAYQFGKALGNEARGRGKDVLLAPGINIVRSPLCGRNFEYMSEDPCLISKLVVPIIKGIQENDVAACVKHFALNNQETNRLSVNVEVDDRALNEIYFPGFKVAVQEGESYTLMGAYNKYKSEYCCHSKFLLNKVLREDWKFDGVVVSDWFAVHDTEKAANCGLDIEMSVTSDFDNYFLASPLIDEVKKGHIDEKVVDEKVYRILKLMYKLNMFSTERKKGSYNIPAHREIALKIAEESIILLKNDNKILPLNQDKIKSIAVIGENANIAHSLGGGSAEIKALYELTPLMGLKMKLGGNAEVHYSRGYSKAEHESIKAQKNHSNDPLTQNQALEAKNEDITLRLEDTFEYLKNEAIELAKKCDTVIVFIGLNHDFDNEGQDRQDMKLPYKQDELVKEILKMNKNAIIVNISGSPVDMEEWIDDAPTVIQSWYNGMEGGLAIANTIFGEVNPSAKLPITFPKRLEDSPAHKLGEFPGGESVHYNEGIFVGYRYFDTYKVEPRFAFGHGLSYTEFEYSDLIITKDDAQCGCVNVELKIKNVGQISGAEIVQLYISDFECSLPRPEKELKDFAKVFLSPQESKKVKFTLDKKAFMYYSDIIGEWCFEAGEFNVMLGSSSFDIRLIEKFEI